MCSYATGGAFFVCRCNGCCNGRGTKIMNMRTCFSLCVQFAVHYCVRTQYFPPAEAPRARSKAQHQSGGGGPQTERMFSPTAFFCCFPVELVGQRLVQLATKQHHWQCVQLLSAPLQSKTLVCALHCGERVAFYAKGLVVRVCQCLHNNNATVYMRFFMHG